MLEVKLTDEMMFELLARASDTEYAKNSIILGSGSDRTAIIYNDFLVAKVPHWCRITESEISGWIRTRQQYCKKSGILTSNDGSKIYIYAENQTALELQITKLIPMSIIKQYAAEIIMWGEWHGHIITFCERLIPATKYTDETTIFEDAKNLLHDMEKTMCNYSIKVADLHAENFAYTKTGQIKFCDLGYWKETEYGFCINWASLYSWRYDSQNANYYSLCYGG